MTDHELDRLAYEACGYFEDAGFPGKWMHESDPSTHFDAYDLAPWSSVDAAIAHAERGGFRVTDITEADGCSGTPYYGARVRKCGGVIVHTTGPTRALAIRNAIAAHKERNP